jgi:hypothetical protein
MKDFKLHLEMPGIRNDQEAWDQESEKIMQVLRKHYSLLDEDFLCGTLLGEMYSNKELRDVCLLALGSDWPGRVLQVGTLRLHGNGPCPNCGSDSYTEHNGGLERDEFDRLVINTIGYTCKECGTEYPA